MPGRLDVEVLGYRGGFPTGTLFVASDLKDSGPCALTLDSSTGRVAYAGRELGRARMPAGERRFCVRLSLDGADGRRRTRLRGHYLAGGDGVIGGDSYNRGTYDDYEAQSAGDHEQVLSLLELHRARAPV